MNSNQKSLGGGDAFRDKNVIVKLLLWCSLSVFIGLSAISQGGVTRFIPGILVSTTILFYLIVIRANSVTYSSLKQFNTKTGVLSIASSAGTLCCVADTIYHMVMKSGAINKLMSKGISTTTIQAVVVIALLTMSFIAMYGVSVIFNYVLSNVVALIDTIIDKKYEINNIVAIVVCALYFFLIVWVYRNTTAFYGSGYNDVIYGSDSYTLTGSNVWLSLFQGQNDLRQPLYMLTAAPFMGIAYILGIILNCFYVNGLAIAYAFVQALLLVWSIWVLSHLISDNDIIRSLIILILSVSYPAIVFSLCLEQYVSSFFWLIMVANFICIIFAYVTNRIAVFCSKSSGISAFREIVCFVVGRLGTLVLDTGIMIFAGNYIGIHYIPNEYQDLWGMVMKILANIVVIVLNYILSKLVVFKK